MITGSNTVAQKDRWLQTKSDLFLWLWRAVGGDALLGDQQPPMLDPVTKVETVSQIRDNGDGDAPPSGKKSRRSKYQGRPHDLHEEKNHEAKKSDACCYERPCVA